MTAPTCGACGIVPGLMYYLEHHMNSITDDDIVDALAVAGIIGISPRSMHLFLELKLDAKQKSEWHVQWPQELLRS